MVRVAQIAARAFTTRTQKSEERADVPRYSITEWQRTNWRSEYWLIANDDANGNVLGRFVACRYCRDWTENGMDRRARGKCTFLGVRVGRNGRCHFFNPGAATLELLVEATREADKREIKADLGVDQ